MGDLPSFRVVASKFPWFNLFAFPNHGFSSISYLPLAHKCRRHEPSYSILI